MKIATISALMFCYSFSSYGMDTDKQWRQAYEQQEQARIKMQELLLQQPNFFLQLRQDLESLSLSELNKREAEMLAAKDRVNRGESLNIIVETHYINSILPIIQETKQAKQRQYHVKLVVGATIVGVVIIGSYILYSRWKDKEKDSQANQSNSIPVLHKKGKI